jgi:protein kinase C substrate 80K-H
MMNIVPLIILLLAVYVVHADAENDMIPVKTNNLKCIKNDNFCDCGDDEPGTSACSMYSSQDLFVCSNQRYVVTSLHSSRINDGVCDCCDGSDEFQSHVKCADNCDEMGKAYILEAQKKANDRALGIAESVKLKAETAAILKEQRENLKKASVRVPELEQNLSSLKSQLREQEEAETREREHQHTVALTEVAKTVDSLNRLQLERFLAVLTIKSKEDAVEAILVDCDEKYESEGDDTDDNEAFALASADFTWSSGVSHEEGMAEAAVGVTGDIHAQGHHSGNSLSPLQIAINAMVKALSLSRLSESFLRSLLPAALARAVEKEVSVANCLKEALHPGIDRINPGIDPTDASSIPIDPKLLAAAETALNAYKEAQVLATTPRPEIEHLKTQVSELEEEIKNTREGNSGAREAQKNHFGQEDFLYPLWGKCYEVSNGGYKYEICPFKEGKQDGHTTLGKYERFEIINKKVPQLVPPTASASSFLFGGIGGGGGGTKSSSSQMTMVDEKTVDLIFNNGDECFATKRPRELTVHLLCSAESKLEEVVETETCVYASTLYTPVACI